MKKNIMVSIVFFCLLLFFNFAANATTINITQSYKSYSYGNAESSYFDACDNECLSTTKNPEITVALVGWDGNGNLIPMNISQYTTLYFDTKGISTGMNTFTVNIYGTGGQKKTLTGGFSVYSDYQQKNYSIITVPSTLLINATHITFHSNNTSVINYKELFIRNIYLSDGVSTHRISGKNFYVSNATSPKQSTWNRFRYTMTGEDSVYTGMGVIINNVSETDYSSGRDLRSYKRLLFNVQSDDPLLDISLKTAGDVESNKFRIENVPNSTANTYVVNLGEFSNIDFSQIKAVHFAPVLQSWITTKNVYISNIRFDDESGDFTATPLLIEKLNVAPGTYVPLVSSADYKYYCSTVWAGYKKMFIENYRNIVNPSVQGLVFDPYSNSPNLAVDSGDKSTSEATGYGMMLSLFMDDQTTFDGILNKVWSTPLCKLATSNLFSWVFDQNGNVLDYNSATDADQDIAMSLVFADVLVQNGKWTNTGYDYKSKAQKLIDSIYKNDYEYYKYVRLGDYYYGGRAITNLSYFSPAFYRIFDLYEDKDHDWQYIIDQGYKVLAAQQGYNLGIAPDWCDSWGARANDRYNSYIQSKDAIRVYWRMANDYVWFGEPRAKQYLANTRNLPAASNPSNITCLNMDGSATLNYTDVSLVGMFSVGALGSNESAYATYRSKWKNAFDLYLAEANNGEYSFFGKSNEWHSKYNYFNQSLGLISALMISGAYPNVYAHLTNPLNPSIQPRNIPANIYNNSLVKIPYVISSPAGGGYINYADLQLDRGGQQVRIRMINDNTQGTCNLLSDPGNVLRLASIQKSIVANNLYVTFNLVVSANWAQGNTAYTITAYDKSGQNANRPNLDSSTFFTYPDDYISPTFVTVNFGSISATTDSVTRLNNPISFACSSPSWNLIVYTDNNAGPGHAGLSLFDEKGVITRNVTLNMLVQDSAATPDIGDGGWRTVFDQQDNADKRVIFNNTTSLPLTNKNLFFKSNFISSIPGTYNADLRLQLISELNKNLIDDFEDNTIQTNLLSYWSAIALTANAGTTASVTTVNNGFKGSTSLKMNYTLGNPYMDKGSIIGAQAIALFNLDPSENYKDISKYKGITFYLKSDNSNPITVALETRYIDLKYDYFHGPIVSPKNQWVKYTLYFKDFQQFGFGTKSIIDNELTRAYNIQFKTLSERPGETGNIYIDEVSFVE